MPGLRIPDTSLFRVLEGETVLVNLASGEYYGLDEIGTHVWRLLVEGLDPGAIAGDLVRAYEVAPERARADVDRLMGELLTHGLVEETGPGR